LGEKKCEKSIFGPGEAQLPQNLCNLVPLNGKKGVQAFGLALSNFDVVFGTI
jgi:hypothetical protein